MLPLGQLFSRFHEISYHSHADDTLIYFSAKPNNLNQLSSLHECLAATKEWMSQNFLHLNPDKTEVLLIGPKIFVTAATQFIGPLQPNIKSTAKNLSIIFDQPSDHHVNKLVQSCFLHLRNIAKIRPILTPTVHEQLIHTFIFSRLDYCNSLYTCLSQSTLKRLQFIQNTAARLLTRTSCRSHITPVLAFLHWLPVKFRINYKILLITYKALHDLTPSCISELLVPHSTSRALRSSNLSLLSIPHTNRKSKGVHAFAFFPNSVESSSTIS